MSSGGRANSLRIRRVAAYTAHSSVASPESRTTRSFGRGRKKRQAGRFPRQGCGIPGGRGKLWTPQQLLRPRVRGAATTLSATRRKTRLPHTSPQKIRGWGCAMWGGPASGFRAFSKKDMSTLPREVRGIPKLRGSRDAPRTIPETSDAAGSGQSRRHKRRAGVETTVAATNNTAGTGPPPRAAHPRRGSHTQRDAPRASAPRNGTRPVPGTKKGVPQNRSSAERLTVTAQGLPGASIAPSPTG